jgi:hypothetical protein
VLDLIVLLRLRYDPRTFGSCLGLLPREVGERALSIEEATHAAFEEAVGGRTQDDIAQTRLEGT